MSVKFLLNSEKLYGGVLINHTPKSMFDTGWVVGFMKSSNETETVLCNRMGTFKSVQTQSLKEIYKEITEFRESINKYIILEELSKYGEINELEIKYFSSKKEVKEYIKSCEKSNKSNSDTKWQLTIHSKFMEQVTFYLDL